MSNTALITDCVLLALETSGKSGSVAVLREQNGQLECNTVMLEPDAGSAKTLAPAIKRLLSETCIEMRSLTAIALLTGPGSFTGLRVGVATAKAMAYALKIPIVEIDTLDAIAQQCPVTSSRMYSVLDAYRGQLFCAEFCIQNIASLPQFLKLSNTQIVDIEILLETAHHQVPVGLPIDLCGPGCERVRKYIADPENNRSGLTDLIAERIRWIDGPMTQPNADSVAKLGYVKYRTGDTLDPFAIQPRYYRGSAAEEVAARPILGLPKFAD